MYHLKNLVILLLFGFLFFSTPLFATLPTLDWGIVTEKTLGNHPDLQMLKDEEKEKMGDLVTAGLKPNPQLDLEAENFLGSGVMSGSRQSEYHLTAALPLESQIKRQNRVQVAKLNQQLFQYEKQQRRLSLLHDLREDYLNCLIAEKQFLMVRDGVKLARMMYRDVRVRAEEGVIPHIEKEKALAELNSRKAKENRMKTEFSITLKRLIANWDGPENYWQKILGKIQLPSTLPRLNELEKKLENTPVMCQLMGQKKLRKAELTLEQSRRHDDPALTAGVNWHRETTDYGFLAGISLPIPWNNRNQGEIMSAKARLAQHPQRVESTRRQLRRQLRQLYRVMKGAWIEARQLRSLVIPKIETAFNSAREGYLEGKYDYLEVLDAQRTLLAEQERLVEKTVICLQAEQEIQRLTGEETIVDKNWMKK